MATRREQITARFTAALVGTTDAGQSVFRSREAVIRKQACPAIVCMPDNEQSQRAGDHTDRHQYTLAMNVFARGDPWDQLADRIAEQAHRVLLSDADLAALATDIRLVSTDYESEEADRTAGTLVARYLITYLARARDIALPPAP